MSVYGVWLSFDNQEEGFQMPVNPESLEIGDGSKGQTYDVAGLGEINVIKNPKLTTFKFNSIFPAQRYPFVAASILFEPMNINGVKTNAYVYYLAKWMESKRPIRFVFTGASFDINVVVSIESFDWKEIAGSGGDIEYTLNLKKYVFYAAQRVKVDKTAATTKIQKVATPRANEKQPPKTYTLRAGDSLWKVAKTQLGNGDRWREIQKLNGITDAQLKKLPIGKVLKLPK